MRTVTELTDAITWIARCESNEDGTHMHLGQYLVETADGYVLVDAGEGHGEALTETIETATDGQGIDAVVLTHSILPHTENVDAIRELWTDATVVSAVGNPAAVGLEGAEPSVAGQSETLAGERFTFIDPLITDVVVSTWIYHHESQTVFTAEGVGHYHAPGECTFLSTEYENGIPPEYVRSFAGDKLQFFEYLDPEKLRIGFDNLLAEYDVDRFAPAHGTPLLEPDIERYADDLASAAGAFGYVSSP